MRDTVRLAGTVEALGYHRFWVSEHHSVPGVAGSAPTVLAAAVAAATSTIRVGTGGVMLPNHQPLVVAEQFGVLASLFPGRMDMGWAVQWALPTASAGRWDGTRRTPTASPTGWPSLGWIDGSQQTYPQVHARPAEGLPIPPYLLATGEGAAIAAATGLPWSSAIFEAGTSCCVQSRVTARTSVLPCGPRIPT
ncbi:LLM class flavin-dependent oxidoreductase [Streptomyces sp. M10(2022)]